MIRAAMTILCATLALGAGRAGAVDVFVYNNQFSINPPGGPVVGPTITAGESVQWVWLQGNHTTTSVSGSTEQWNAPISSSNPSFARTFNTPGVFWYYCIPHGNDNLNGTASGMAGTVTVLPSETGACCVPISGCVVMTPAGCLNAGGTYQGAGTSCEPDPCDVDVVTAEVPALRDNVLYETVDGSTSNALGRFLFAGNQNNGARRRGVIAFDLGTIPVGSTVVDASVRLYCNQSSGGPVEVKLHRLMREWGEGTSLAGGNEGSGTNATNGDATWLHAFWPFDLWSMPGGDFAHHPSGSALVNAQNVPFVFTGMGLMHDVQSWLDTPGANHGWLLKGDEADNGNTKRFDSRQGNTPSNHPRLLVTFVPPGPSGRCCLPDGSCRTVDSLACGRLGGIFGGEGSSCHHDPCPVALTPFVDALPRPAIAQPVTGNAGGAAHYEIAMTEQFQFLHRDLPPTRVWGYDGSYPGPTIEARRDQAITVTWINDLRVAESGALRTTHVLHVDECLHGPDVTGSTPVAVVHLHGGVVEPESDGYPEDTFPPGQQSDVYNYPNIQPAATLWYHDHALGITRLNVMMGLAGFYILRDDVEDALGLPAGEYEIPLAIQDRTIGPDGSIVYHDEWHEHFFGDLVLVNGKVWPYLEVDRGKYRFRLLNGSNSRAYTLFLSDNSHFWQIGTDLGLLEEPIELHSVTILPGERADVIIDFSGHEPGSEIVLTNSAPAPFPGFAGVGVVPNVMKFVVGSGVGHTDPIPAALTTIERLDPQDAVRERVLDLRTAQNVHCPDHHGPVWTIDGLMWDDITEFPVLGTTEIWTWRNASGISHPMHMHLVKVQVLNRQAIDDATGEPTGPLVPPRQNELGWKDTVDAPPGYYTRVITRFEGFTGTYAYHCHILEHEDHEMMRQFVVVAPCPCDIDGDRVQTVSDYFAYLTDFFAQLGGPGSADLDGDGVVTVSDFFQFLNCLPAISISEPCP